MSIGFRIAKRTRKVYEATVERFRALPVANVSDCMARMTAGGARLRPMHAGGAMAGPALAVKTRPGDNLMVPRALDIGHHGGGIVVRSDASRAGTAGGSAGRSGGSPLASRTNKSNT